MVVTLSRLDPDRVRELARAIVESGVSARVDAAERLREAADALARWFAALPAPARAIVLGTLLVLAAAAVRALLSARRAQRVASRPALPLRQTGGVLALAAGLCAAAWLEARHAEELPTGAGTVLHAGSTLDATARGASALARLLDRLGVRVRRIAHPWPPPRGVRALVVLSPEEPPSADELRALGAWVERGGIVVLGLGSGPFGVSFGLDDAFGISLREVEVYGRVRVREGPLEVEVPAGRVLAGADLEPLVRSERGPLCARRRQGKGQVIACAGSFLFSNDGLVAADDAAFVARWLSEAAQGGSLGFDEFHHGAGTRIDLPVLLAQSPVGWALIQLAVALVLLAWSRGRRAGAGLP